MIADHYDPDYEFLQQDLSNTDQIPQQVACNLSPLPESSGESGSPFLGPPFQLPLGSCALPEGPSATGLQMDTPPALPEKKRRSAASQTTDSSGCRVSYTRHPSQYDNVSEDDLRGSTPAPAGPTRPSPRSFPCSREAPRHPWSLWVISPLPNQQATPRSHLPCRKRRTNTVSLSGPGQEVCFSRSKWCCVQLVWDPNQARASEDTSGTCGPARSGCHHSDGHRLVAIP